MEAEPPLFDGSGSGGSTGGSRGVVFHSTDLTRADKVGKDALRGEELGDCVKLGDLAFAENEDAVAVHHGLDPVRDRQGGAAGEGLSD